MAGYGACGGSGLSAPAVNHTDRVLKQLLEKRLAAIPICFVHCKMFSESLRFRQAFVAFKG